MEKKEKSNLNKQKETKGSQSSKDKNIVSNKIKSKRNDDNVLKNESESKVKKNYKKKYTKNVKKQQRLKLIKKIDKVKLYSFDEAFKILSEVCSPSLDETVEIHVNLGIDAKKTDQNINTYCDIENPLNINRKIIVIAEDFEKIKKECNPYECGDIELLDKIVKRNKLKFDCIITSPNLMSKFGKYARKLGTAGLLPNSKAGTINDDLISLHNKIKNHRVFLKNDKNAVVHFSIGKASTEIQILQQNYDEVIKFLIKKRPSTQKGNFIKSVFICLTMSPALKINNKFF